MQLIETQNCYFKKPELLNFNGQNKLILKNHFPIEARIIFFSCHRKVIFQIQFVLSIEIRQLRYFQAMEIGSTIEQVTLDENSTETEIQGVKDTLVKVIWI